MPPTRSSDQSGIVFFTYKARKVALVRPKAHKDAIKLAKKTFASLSAVSEGRIAIHARLPNHQEEGVVEVSAEAWQIATSGVKSFTIDILPGDAEDDEADQVVEVANDTARAPTRPSLMGRTSGRHSEVTGQRTFRREDQSLSLIINQPTVNTTRFRMVVASSDSVADLKAKMGEKKGICLREHSLLYNGTRLEDSFTLGHYGLEDDDVLDLFPRQTGGKPVIYLYPPSPIAAKVQLSLVPQWKLSAVYPQPVKGSFKEGRSAYTAEWNVVAHPSGMMTMNGSSEEFAYIFWEAETEAGGNPPDSPPASRPASPLTTTQTAALPARTSFFPASSRCTPQDSVLMSLRDIPSYLQRVLRALGLHTEARTSFITYWLPSFLKHEHIALRFVPQADFEASAPLSISPQPDVITRVFMLFEGVPADQSAHWQEARERSSMGVQFWKGVVGIDEIRQRDASLFRVLEWGGMEVR
ncbi:hypothetical protein FRB90_012087 [Tulasnella sp. 427]|nr:hypothetical protein FRB90_012087 [Tulasnella sp. 427]